MERLNRPCSQCGGRLEPGEVTQEVERELAHISISGIPALVCQGCSEWYIDPVEAQALAETVKGLSALARCPAPPRTKVTASVSWGDLPGKA